MMIDESGKRLDVWRCLELLAVGILSASILGLLAMRLGVFHAWPIWLLSILATFAYGHRFPATAAKPLIEPPAWHVLVIVLVALLFRLTPYVYQLGGQDEGIYTNMAAYLMHTGGLVPSDAILQSSTSAEARSAYLLGNYSAPKHYLPGIYGVEGSLEFQFYHLFPVWLALFGDILGVDKIGYGLCFLALVSVVFFQRVAHQLTGSAKAGLVAGLLLAVNPLHAFFSKFPVTEIPTLAFSLISLSFLLAYWKAPEDHAQRRYLYISALGMAGLFMTRISGFMYLPLILGVLFLALMMDHRSLKRRPLLGWAGLTIALYVASIAYGLEWSRIYSVDIYNSSFGPALGPRWKFYVLALVVGLGLAWVAFWYAANEQRRQANLLKTLQPLQFLLPVILVAATAISLWRAYRLGYTDAYAEHQWYGKMFGLSHSGYYALRSVSLIATTLYVSPFLLFGFYVASVRRRLDPAMAILLVFVTAVYCYIAVLQWVLPYQPYYARYLASEFVPYMLLFVVVSWQQAPTGNLRRFLASCLVICGAWSLVLSVQQIGKNEHQGVQQSLTRLSQHWDPRDLVFVDKGMTEPLAHEVKTALVYTYGINVVTVTPPDLQAGGYGHRLASTYNDVYFVTRSLVAPPGFTEVDSVDFLEKFYCHGSMPPTELCVRSDSRLMVYKRTSLPPAVAGDTALALNADSRKIGTLVGTREGARIVADGRAGVLMFGPYVPLGAGRYTVEVRGTGSKPFTLDLVANKGREVIYRSTFETAKDGKAGILAKADVELKQPVDDLEIRLLVQPGSDASIDGYVVLHR
ncbi:hypothetical protein [Pseudoxanthomonas indica]|uniref:Dolichyl-phosphate-mannose-protein mannosyltransferase n=1 Tax=Pseudoxanthomonas indica TaxID=428993 RepID=A0A1T5LEZ0_9GAMM|nr:hypothetical protein [Pseudoxanthomonas indica]GGD34215.1 hypothetical protein GCM10007235_02560 [Pseudoxanthomonas indica]SKC74265.1 hypothetical protein SAMN06296058_2383 [Pseudoxanthomonas indica]